MKQLNDWFSIDEKEYLMYLLMGYEIIAEATYVEWILDGKTHREDGPAYIHEFDGSIWFLHGKYHRTDGPAILFRDGRKEWYINDEQYSEEAFNDYVSSMV